MLVSKNSTDFGTKPPQHLDTAWNTFHPDLNDELQSLDLAERVLYATSFSQIEQAYTALDRPLDETQSEYVAKRLRDADLNDLLVEQLRFAGNAWVRDPDIKDALAAGRFELGRLTRQGVVARRHSGYTTEVTVAVHPALTGDVDPDADDLNPNLTTLDVTALVTVPDEQAQDVKLAIRDFRTRAPRVTAPWLAPALSAELARLGGASMMRDQYPALLATSGLADTLGKLAGSFETSPGLGGELMEGIGVAALSNAFAGLSGLSLGIRADQMGALSRIAMIQNPRPDLFGGMIASRPSASRGLGSRSNSMEPVANDDHPAKSAELVGLKVVELRELARGAGYRGISRMTKRQLIDLLSK